MGTTPPPQPVQDVNSSTGERVSRGIGGFLTGGTGQSMKGSALDDAIKAHHEKRLHEAQMHQQSWATAHAISTTGTYPADTTDDQGMFHKAGSQLTEADKLKYKNQADAALTLYKKTAGVDKDTKAMVDKHVSIAQHLSNVFQRMKGGGQQQQQGGAAPPAPAASPAGGPTPPPQPPGAAGAGSAPPIGPDGTSTSSGGFKISGAGGPKMTAPPPPPVPLSGPASAPAAAAKPSLGIEDEWGLQQQQRSMDEKREDDHDFGMWKRKAETAHDYKMEELKEAAAAKAANPTGRASALKPISIQEARKLATKGMTFKAADGGDDLILDNYDDTMMLVPLQQNGHIVGYSPANQAQKHLTFNNNVVAVPEFSVLDADATGKTLGQHNVGSTTRSTDPATGQTTVSTRTPGTGGSKSGGGTAAPTTLASGGGGKSAQAAGSAGGKKQLGPDGHIPTDAQATPQVIEGANQLIDDRDVDRIPAKTRELSAQLARKYGWEQGKFTPKEQTQLREATTFLNQAADDPSLSVLDEGVGSRLKVSQVLGDHSKDGFIGRAGTIIATKNLTEKEAQFVGMYNQLVGTISGLSSLVRSGRATEATIERLKQELPGVLSAKNSADAKSKIARLQKEIDVALEKGQFGAAEAKSGRGTLPPPPSASTSSGGLSPQAKAYLKSQGIAVP